MSWYEVDIEKGSIAEVTWHRKPRMVGRIEKKIAYNARHRREYVCYLISPIFSVNRTNGYDYKIAFGDSAYHRYWREDRVKILCSPTTKNCECCKYKFSCFTAREYND